MNIDWDLVYLVLAILAGVVLTVWVLIGVWFWRAFNRHERRAEERQKRQEQIRNRRENW